MKKYFLWAILSLPLIIHAQIKSAKLTAAGLTCSMCSKAVYNSLDELSFIDTIGVDLNTSTYSITFKTNMDVDPDKLRKAVEDAGFSVSSLQLNINFNKTEVQSDKHINLNGYVFHFLDVEQKTLNGEQTIKLVDKGFIVKKEFSKFSKSTKHPCYKTGQTDACCKVDGEVKSQRVYHVTL